MSNYIVIFFKAEHLTFIALVSLDPRKKEKKERERKKGRNKKGRKRETNKRKKRKER